MADETYTVKISRRDGVVEITGTDKDWIAQQIDKLAVVFTPQPADLEDDEQETPGEDEGSTPPDGNTGGGTGSTTPTPSTPTRRRGRSQFRGAIVEDVAAKLTPDVRQALEAFVEARRAHFSRAPEQAAILATFLQDETDHGDIVQINDLYTVYSVMGWRAPNPRNALDNAKARNGYFTSNAGRYRLTHTGEQFGRHESKVAPASS